MLKHAHISSLRVLAALVLAAGTVKAENTAETAAPQTNDPSFDAVKTLPSSSVADAPRAARVSTLSSADLVEWPQLSAAVKGLLTRSLALTRQNLFYQYDSDDPSHGGMDCSGTIHYLLGQAGLGDVPRDSSELYTWVWKAGHFQAVVSSDPDTFELSRLHPGDLLFWTGTYAIHRDPPVTHVMIYLGTSRLTGRRVMVGASDGRTFNDQPRYGVSVFDFKIPRPAGTGGNGHSSDRESRFIGYSPIPGLEKTSTGSEISDSGPSHL